jgi:hypothetical protein
MSSATTKGAKLLDTPLSYIVFILAALAIGYTISSINYKLGFLLIGGLLGGTVALICLFNTRHGFFISMTLSFFMFYIKRVTRDAIPLGIMVDMLIAITFIGIYYKKTIYKQPLGKYFHNPITYLFLIYLGFLFVELFNPSMYSIAGWIFTVRKYLNFVMLYFIGLHIFNTQKDVKDFIKLWMILSIIAGAYGCYQEWHGLPAFEQKWVMSDPLRYKLYFQGGTIRKFSVLSDPTAYGILMADGTVLGLVLAITTGNTKFRRLLITGIILMGLGVAYSGTRTAYIMIPAGISLFTIMTITNRKTLLFTISFLIFFVIIIFGPFYNNGTVNRIRSAFDFSSNESLNVRDKNREMVQPYMLSHPIGGGVCTSGVLGLQYNPGHPLAGFPPDSGYLRSALETGWIGLFLSCSIFFTILYLGVRNYYLSKTKEVRGIYVGLVAALFAYVVANYAQVAIGQFPGSFFFYGAIAVIVKLRGIEREQLFNTNNIK